MRKTILIAFVFLICSSVKINAQSTSDSLEEAVINYLKTSEDIQLKHDVLYVRFYAIPTKYIIYIQNYRNKPCEKDVSRSHIYKAFTLPENRNIYFVNEFIEKRETNKLLFLNDAECENLKDESTLSESIMLLIDNNFSIEKKVIGINYDFSMQELLCKIRTENSSVKKK
ncbi:hypothetical protein [uncultured Flavobacterium sp.]|uniref:hypothetical protein n=1 Tax=uncultured Flavobacterium sp. TaxID=165435 RepID=UPI0030813E0D